MGELPEQKIQTQLLGLGDELEMAIRTLKKLQNFTGSLATDASQEDQPQLDLRASPVEGTVDIVVDTSEIQSANTAGQIAESAAPMLRTGETFGRYQVSRQLGRGAMGAVYLVYDPELERYVALKTPFLGDNPHAAQRFLREARTAAQIRSPFVCPIYDVGNVAGILYITMAFIEGQSLAQRIHQTDEPRTLDDVTTIFGKLAQGLQKAHGQSIIHRDLKPDNIMVDSDGEPVIMDFGLARRVDDEIRMTSAGGLLGTPAYMSPEQVRGEREEIGPQSDIYSLGVVLYEMLTGTVPFEGPLMTVLHKVIHEEPPPPSDRQPNLPPDSTIERICLKAMAKRKQDRFSNIDDVLAALHGTTVSQDSSPVAGTSLFKAVWKRSGKIFASLTGQSSLTSQSASAQSISQTFECESPVQPRPNSNSAM